MPSCSQRVGTPNAQHNLQLSYRKHLSHVNPEMSKYNEVIRHKTVEEIYQEHLQPAFEKFNEKQKRKDRRLDVKYDCTTYLGYQRALDKKARASNNAIDQKGRPPIRELVLQFGNPEQGYGSAGQTEESRERIKGMLLEVQQEIEYRYPQFVWGDVVFHADEESLDAEGKQCGTLHIHSSFVPLCYDNKKGPEVQVAFERCLREMGFPTFEAWKHDLDDIMEMVLQKHGLERTVMGNTEKHQDYKQFHRQQKLILQTKELEAEIKDLQEEVQIAETMMDNYQEIAETYKGEAEQAQEELLQTRESISSLQAEKTALEGNIEVLQERNNKAQDIFTESVKALQLSDKRINAAKTQYVEMERELSGLQEQISEAKSELASVETAIKKKMNEGEALFGRDNLQERILEARAKSAQAEKIKKMEKLIGMFERFLQAHPQVNILWQQFCRGENRENKSKKERPSEEHLK